MEASVVGLNGWGEDGWEVEAESVEILGEFLEIGIDFGVGLVMRDCDGGHVQWRNGLGLVL